MSTLTDALQPTAVVVEEQQLREEQRHVRWNGFPVAAMRMNLYIMDYAAQLMARHADRFNVTYAAAIRVRLDVGGSRMQTIGSLAIPAPIVWNAMRAEAALVYHHGERLPWKNYSKFGAVHSCAYNPKHPLFSRGADLCYWSAPPKMLGDMLTTTLKHFDQYFPTELITINATATNTDLQERAPHRLKDLPSTLRNVRVCVPSLVKYPEGVLSCVLRDLGLAAMYTYTPLAVDLLL